MSRRPDGAPPLHVEIAIVLGAAVAAFALMSLPRIVDWVITRPVALQACRAEAQAITARANHLTTVVTGCLNFGTLSVHGEVAATCRRPR